MGKAKMNIMKKGILVVSTLLLLTTIGIFAIRQHVVTAAAEVQFEDEVYSDFADDKVVVVLGRESSRNLSKTYTSVPS
jgi:hypothetical protein